MTNRIATTTILFCLTIALASCTQGDRQEAASTGEQSTTMTTTSAFPDPAVPQGANLAVPENWLTRFDRDNTSVTVGTSTDSADVAFLNMTPGWHLTTGPAGIFYHPASTATGTYRATMGAYLFDPGDRTEGYGLLFGGNDLQGDDQSYLYFLIRNDKKFLVKQREGGETYVLQGWTTSDSINQFTAESAENVYNELEVAVGESEIVFAVNGDIVHTIVNKYQTDGAVGFRVNHGLNLHISKFSIN